MNEKLLTLASKFILASTTGNDIELKQISTELANELTSTKTVETTTLQQEKKKTLSAFIKFSKEEINMMSKTFKKEFIANGCVGKVIKRPSGKKSFCYEIRYRRNGYNISVSNTDVNIAKKLFIAATKNLETPEALARNKTKFETIIDEWLEYKKGKITYHQWQNHESRARRFIPENLKNKQIKDIHTADIDKLLNFNEEPRMYEELRSLFNQIFKYAKASGIISHNPVELIPFKRAKRKKRKPLTEEQIKAFFNRLKLPEFERIRQIAYTLYFFGLRPCEIDKELIFENDFLICRNRKRKGGAIEYKKIPIPEQAREYIDFTKPIKYPIAQHKTAEIIKKALGDKLTPYNLRHTFATICAQHVREEIVEVWLGDSPERLTGKFYVHYPDKFMKEQMNLVKFIMPE